MTEPQKASPQHDISAAGCTGSQSQGIAPKMNNQKNKQLHKK